MGRMVQTAVIVFVLAILSPPALALECGEETCPAGAMCIDRGDGERCWSLCRLSLDCESRCCIQIRYPFTAWICADAEECYPESDGDGEEGEDGEDPATTDGDAGGGEEGEEDENGDAGSDPRPHTPEVCGTETCTRIERCVLFDGDEPECTPVCRRAFDCTSECCVVGYADVAVCMPLDMDCPREQRIKVDPACSGGGETSLSLWLLLAGLLALHHRRSRRQCP